MTPPSQAFSLLSCLYPDAEMTALWAHDRMVRQWLRFEHALARAQAQVGVISPADSDAICGVDASSIDLDALWPAARNVGYPILPLVRQMAAQLPAGPDGRVHYGATTQDVMDTGLALTLRDSCDHLQRRVDEMGDALVALMTEHRDTVMPGRTHGQQAVPTTFGGQLASVVAELTRNRGRLRQARTDASTVSLFGAGGTSAGLGLRARDVRELMAADLGLATTVVPWHAARDSLVSVAQAAQLIAGVCARIARNVVDLSRTEVGELHEAAGAHRGASSTMPQKANPILAEGIIGMSAVVGPLVAALSRTLEVPQERAAGEWQIEWHVLPQVFQLTAGCVGATVQLLDGLRVDTEAMRRNLDHDGGLVMAEAAMIALAEPLGRELAHDLVYAAALDVRALGCTLEEAVHKRVADSSHDIGNVAIPKPEDYLGDVRLACDDARTAWLEASSATGKG